MRIYVDKGLEICCHTFCGTWNSTTKPVICGFWYWTQGKLLFEAETNFLLIQILIDNDGKRGPKAKGLQLEIGGPVGPETSYSYSYKFIVFHISIQTWKHGSIFPSEPRILYFQNIDSFDSAAAVLPLYVQQIPTRYKCNILNIQFKAVYSKYHIQM